MPHKTATVLFVDRGSSARSLKKHRVDHSVLPGSNEVWARIVAAATAASGSEELAQRALWLHVDRQVVDKSVAVKATVQALCLRKLEFKSADLALWMRRARVVATGLHTLYAEAMRGWDRGLNERLEADARAIVPVDAWSPFELYDRTDHPRFAGCFGESAVQRMRSRVRVADAARPAWEAAVDAHWQMLALEAEADVLAVSPTLSAAEVGGLFLLSHTADNWPKRPEVFDEDFWLLRVVHLGLERNTSLQIAKFDLGVLRRAQSPEPLVDSRKVYCWLVNAIVALVALKVAIFYKVRVHAYDAAAGRPLTTEHAFSALVKVDRHDLEQSKSHWRPTMMPSPTTSATAAPSSPSACSACSASSSDEAAPKRARREETFRSLLNVDQLVPVRDVLERLVVERRALRARVEVLDTAVSTHLAFHRLVKERMDALHRTALSRLDALTEHLSTTDAPSARAEAEAEMQRISNSFTLTKIQKAAIESARTELETTGVLLRVEDRVWSTDHPSVRTLVAVGTDAHARSVRRHVRDANEFDRLFGSDGMRGELGMGAAPVVRCAPDGVLRTEACSLADRLLGLVRAESELREVASLDTLVRVPIELTAPLVLANKLATDLPTRVPAHVKEYAAALKADETHAKASHFCATAKRAMGNAMRRAVDACAKEAAAKTDESLPYRIKQHERRARCALAVLGAMLSVAHAFGGLAVDDDDGEVRGVVPILVWHCETRRWRVPFAERVVEDHWEAAKLLLWIASSTEGWLKDPRKPSAFELDVDATWVCPGPHGPLVRAAQQSGFVRWMDAQAARLESAWWPYWPPKASQITTIERIRTALTWGREKHTCAFLTLDAETAKAYSRKVPWG